MKEYSLTIECIFHRNITIKANSEEEALVKYSNKSLFSLFGKKTIPITDLEDVMVVDVEEYK